ncbi:molybdopterin-dependent oxidoreductase [Ideonella sp.]|uniref:molybdopterin-dependent oxidoreductase n=1 Tax=Ideonella sp. TaxID=1929293 RepID=UPI002B475435|nr:molybdopterin-dependent oxidoreductase [Ideonella sp.]HJV72485.1 molybdopterin-dependent oxidoreductase [Ideonella sp.]
MSTLLLTRRRCLAGLLAWGGAHAAVPPRAALLAQPHGTVVLSIDGQIRRTNADARADFDLEMLAALPQRQLVTHTPWHQGPQTFTGPLLRDVLAEVGAAGQRLVAVALNDYRCEIPVDDTAQFDVVLARLHNGEAMRVRDKGPLFIVYPFDSDPQLRSERYYARSAWQVRRLIVQS